jgi:large subunit ribosomal protein L9e
VSQTHPYRLAAKRYTGEGISRRAWWEIALSNPTGHLAGKLTKDLSHIAVNFSVLKKNVIGIEIHHGSRKNVAALRTVRTIINNLIIGVTKGFKYKMRYVYAHFPINVNVEKNAETGNFEVEIRYVAGG